MDEILEQFLVESRELVDQAMDDLLLLERTPADRERLDSAFRAFHTLKGGAAIVEFPAMQRALHAAENVLAAARAGGGTLAAADIGNCLACLDQVGQWLGATQESGQLPRDAELESAALVRGFARNAGSAPAAPGDASGAAPNWVPQLLRAHPEAARQARTAICCSPDADSFFRGEDPLAWFRDLPGLLALGVEPASPWPASLDAVDPFTCNVVLKALTSLPEAEAKEALGKAARHGTFFSLAQGQPAAASASPTGDTFVASARAVLEAQVALLAEPGEEGAGGRLAAAGNAAANVMRALGRGAEAERIAGAARASLAAQDAAALAREIGAGIEALGGAPGTAARAADAAVSVKTLRVDAARVDALVRLTGELGVAKNAIGHAARLLREARGDGLAALEARHATLERLVGELQRAVLGLRVLPLRSAFQRFPRLVREMAADLGKPAVLQFEGEETEADKAIVEMIAEPLTHVLRNAMDHGIEDAATRAAAGKPAEASLRLRAAREGDNVILEFSDDGGGLDLERIRAVARERGLMPAQALAGLDDAQLADLVFAPGFSTASAVTAVSGRGVGMDAVRTAVRRFGGQVEIRSQRGKGTTVRFSLPFSVMVTQVMTVVAGGQTFGIAIDAIVETLRVPAAAVAAVGAGQAIVFRERTLPLIDLSGVVGAAQVHDPARDAVVVVFEIEGEQGGLRVDGVGERMEIMLKPLEGLLAGLPGIAGSTLLGDGSVLLVLDLAELLR